MSNEARKFTVAETDALERMMDKMEDRMDRIENLAEKMTKKKGEPRPEDLALAAKVDMLTNAATTLTGTLAFVAKSYMENEAKKTSVSVECQLLLVKALAESGDVAAIASALDRVNVSSVRIENVAKKVIVG